MCAKLHLIALFLLFSLPPMRGRDTFYRVTEGVDVNYVLMCELITFVLISLQLRSMLASLFILFILVFYRSAFMIRSAILLPVKSLLFFRKMLNCFRLFERSTKQRCRNTTAISMVELSLPELWALSMYYICLFLLLADRYSWTTS